jgi:hypothetical protein
MTAKIIEFPKKKKEKESVDWSNHYHEYALKDGIPEGHAVIINKDGTAFLFKRF